MPSPRTVIRRCAVECVGPIHGIDHVPIFCQRLVTGRSSDGSEL
jgi:hypothetical protein